MTDQLDIIIQEEVAYIFDTLDMMTCEDADTFARKSAFCVPYAQAINRAGDVNIKNGTYFLKDLSKAPSMLGATSYRVIFASLAKFG